jgi:tRNA(Ile)-lysidine synthase
MDGLLARCNFPAAGSEVVCAVSGGADSLALLVLATHCDLRVEAVHVDHGLRPGSDREAEVVADVARRFGARFRSERVVVAPGGDLEARARRARREVLGPDALTGHTADDQAETLLVNLLRGAGVSGLAGMRPGPTHPILGLRRAETHRLCRDLGLEPVLDPSNTDLRFVRNRIRGELLPLMAEISGRDPVPLLFRTTGSAREATDWLDAQAEQIDATDARAVAAAPAPVAAAALRRWLRTDDGHPPSAAEVERVMQVARRERRACEISGHRRVARSGGRLRVEAD